MSPTQLTLRHMRNQGYIAQVVERWNPYAQIRQDLFGIIDVVAVGNGQTVGIQSTSYTNVSKRVKKIAESEFVGPLREAGWTLIVQGWHQPNGPRTRYKVREVDVS